MVRVIQLVGALLVLVGFTAAQWERLDRSSRAYLTLNLAGSLPLAAAAVVEAQPGFLLLKAPGPSCRRSA